MSQTKKCEKCGNDFKLIEQEVEFYKEKDFPAPVECPTCRRERRKSWRHERELYGYNCDNCSKDIVVAFKPPEDMKIFCKTCYQKFMEKNDCILGYSEDAKKEVKIKSE